MFFAELGTSEQGMGQTDEQEATPNAQPYSVGHNILCLM